MKVMELRGGKWKWPNPKDEIFYHMYGRYKNDGDFLLLLIIEGLAIQLQYFNFKCNLPLSSTGVRLPMVPVGPF